MMNEQQFGKAFRDFLLGLLGVQAEIPVGAVEKPVGAVEKREITEVPGHVIKPGAKVVENPEVKPVTLPRAGTDAVDITIVETYEVEGIGRDQVTLKGVLTTERATPLLGFGVAEHSWDNSTVVAKFTSLDLKGQSDVFGPVNVKLDPSTAGFGVVQNGKCAAAMPIEVSMPAHDLHLRSATPIQLQSQVTTVPPIGDEKTESVAPVTLVDKNTGKARGQIIKARVAWRELTTQSFDAIGVAE